VAGASGLEIQTKPKHFLVVYQSGYRYQLLIRLAAPAEGCVCDGSRSRSLASPCLALRGEQEKSFRFW